MPLRMSSGPLKTGYLCYQFLWKLHHFLVPTPLLRYTGLNRTCHVELSWHLMRITSAYNVQQGKFTTASMQPSFAIKSRRTAQIGLSFLHRGQRSSQAGGGCFQTCLGAGRLIFPASFYQEGGLGSHGRWWSLLLSFLQKLCASAYILRSQTASF